MDDTQPPGPPVLPTPTPTAIQFELARMGENTYVVVNFYTNQGVSVFFLETEIAFMVAKQLRSAAQQSQHQPVKLSGDDGVQQTDDKRERDQPGARRQPQQLLSLWLDRLHETTPRS